MVEEECGDIKQDAGLPEEICRSCGAANYACLSYHHDRKRFWCCDGGTTVLPPLGDYPELLKALLTETVPTSNGRIKRSPRSESFHSMIRQYNNAFAFTSLGVSFDEKMLRATEGVYSFRIHGVLYHRMGPLEAAPGDKPGWAQLYLYDTRDERLNMRLDRYDGLDAGILGDIQDVLEQCNPYMQFYINNSQRLRDDSNLTISLRIINPADQGKDPRRYNKPTADEVAAIIPIGGASTYVRDITLKRRSDGEWQRIPHTSSKYLPLMYPLLFPNGEDGWFPDIPMASRSVRPSRRVLATSSGVEADDIGHADDIDGADNADKVGDGAGAAEGSGAPGRPRFRVTRLAWHRFYLADRHGQFNAILHSGRLLHQFVVDAWASTEESKLFWYEQNQASLRADLYCGLADAIASDGGLEDAAQFGRRVILPSSHPGSPRHMQQEFQDSLAIARRYTQPEMFLTFTCNPKWKEILAQLGPGETPNDRPDVVVKVFKVKVDVFLKDLTKHCIMGKAVGWCYVIEFQKRGLPHAHILLILDDADRIYSTRDVDATCCAEIPDKDADPELYDIIVNNMIHGPCGERYDPGAPCMREGKCSKRFPKPFCEETVREEGKYPIYRRRDNGKVVMKPCKHRGGGPVPLNNCWVVPYNPYLSKRYNAHINVELCGSLKAVKYLYKYVYKGPDKAMTEVSINGDTVNEVRQYQDCRYFSAHEACWRLFRFPIHGRYPAVVRLQVHLPDQQMVFFTADGVVGDMAERVEISRKTTLTEFFSLNASIKSKLDNGQELAEWERRAYGSKYQDWPEFMTFDKKARVWRSRSRNPKPSIGRMYTASPRQGDRFYLRMLLATLPSWTSFEDVRTVDGVLCNTFKDACARRGLLDDDFEWDAALSEAGHAASGFHQRQMFIWIIINCAPRNPVTLWNNHWESLTDDTPPYFERKLGMQTWSDDQRRSLGLEFLVREYISVNGSVAGFPLPEPTTTFLADRESAANRLLYDETHYDVRRLDDFLSRKHAMNEGQAAAFQALDDALNLTGTLPPSELRLRQTLFFLDGPGGTGKTFLQNILLAHVRKQGEVALAVASTGIAATLLEGGRTAHSRFKIPLKVYSDSTCDISKRSDLAELLRHTKLIIWDEAVMIRSEVFDAVDRTLRDILDCSTVPFGGIVVCFCGDFRQTLPVIPGASRAEIVGACLKKSKLWRYVRVLKLTENMRLRSPTLSDEDRERDRAFAQRLLSVGESTGADNMIEWPSEHVVNGNTLQNLAQQVYDDLHARIYPESYFNERAILAARNDVVSNLNTQLLQQMPGQTVEKLSTDCVVDAADATKYPVEVLNQLSEPGLPPHKLMLKEGCPVMLLRNLDPRKGLCNGTRLQVKSIARHVLFCTYLDRDRVGPEAPADGVVLLPRICCRSSEDGSFVEFDRKQFPIRVCFAMTINKSQGQSLGRVGIYLNPEVFSHGQLYVSFSRTTNRNKIWLADDGTGEDADGKGLLDGRIRNIVYDEVFSEF
jgi:hypothetical protein